MVSGANRGIGLAIARKLHSLGYCVSAAARDLHVLRNSIGELGTERMSLHRYDAQAPEVCKTWVAETVERWGRIDALVNVAGILLPIGIEHENEADFDLAWAVNVKAPLRMTRLVLPYLRQSGAGRIVNMASLSGKRVRNLNVAYSMTKFALVALTHTTRRLGWEHGIRATAVCPGWVDTAMAAAHSSGFPREQMTTLDDIAALVATTLALPNNAVVAELLVNCKLEDSI